MALFWWWNSLRSNLEDGGDTRVDAPDVSVRRRNLQNLTPTQDDVPAAVTEPQQSPAPQKAQAPRKPKPTTKAVPESLSVILRRQVPIRFDEEPRSWLGGLPKMPAGTAWPHVKPKKPLHFVAQLDCAGLPPELWGGLGPRTGWLLLFADIEAIDEQRKRPIARVIHVPELGPEAEPPAGLYFARRDIIDIDRLPGTLPNAQRQHFRRWPVDLVPSAPDTSGLTGGELYGAPENDLIISASMGFTIERPMTWRGAYTILAALVLAHDARGFESNWRGNALGMLDYAEPDINDFNREWQERRVRLPEWNVPGQFYQADERLKAQMYEERRHGWTRRAFKVLDEELAVDEGRLAEYRTQLADAIARGDEKAVHDKQHSVEFYEKKTAQHRDNRAYLRDLFAQYPNEEALVAEINRVGRAYVAWAGRTYDRLRDMFDRAGKQDLDAPIAPADWDAIAAEIVTMKSEFWQKTFDTDVLRKVERGVSHVTQLSDVVREELLDRYATTPAWADGLDPDRVADLEPRLRNLECDRPHKLGGQIDSVYEDPLKKEHILLFQIASDAAIGWIWGDLGLIYVSIHPSDLEAGAFDNVRAWLEA